MANEFEGKIVVVSGGSRGIGRAIALAFAREGAQTVLAASNAANLEAAAKAVAAGGPAPMTVAGDLRTLAGCEQLFAQVSERFQRCDVLVNNAGATWGAPLSEHDTASWERVLNLNVQGVFHTTKFFVPVLEATASTDRPSRVINIGSIDGIHVPSMDTFAYSASKAAVHQLTRHLAKTMAPKITVNAIAPGPFPSRMMRATLEAHGDEIAKAAPMKRIGQPSDMAGAAIFLASPAASYITGVILPVDGGLATLA